MSVASGRERQFYAARLRNERRRQGSAFEARFSLTPEDYRWVDPEVNLDYFEPNTYPTARPRVLPIGLRQTTHNSWSSLAVLTGSMWTGRGAIRLLLDSMRSVGAIEVDASRMHELFRQLLFADGDAVVAATPDWACWALFDVHALGTNDFRVDAVLRGEWAGAGPSPGGLAS